MEDLEEIEEVMVSLAAANETGVDVAIVAILSELDVFFSIKKRKKRAAQEAFLSGEEVFALFLTGTGQSLIQRQSTLQPDTVRLHARSFALLTKRKRGHFPTSVHAIKCNRFLWASPNLPASVSVVLKGGFTELQAD